MAHKLETSTEHSERQRALTKAKVGRLTSLANPVTLDPENDPERTPLRPAGSHTHILVNLKIRDLSKGEAMSIYLSSKNRYFGNTDAHRSPVSVLIRRQKQGVLMGEGGTIAATGEGVSVGAGELTQRH